MGEDGREEECNDEAADGGEGGEAGAAASADTSGTFDIGGSGGGAKAGSAGGGYSVGHEDLVDAVDVAFLIDHAGFLRNADNGAHGVEHVDKEEGEEDDEHVEREHFAPLELAEDGGYRRRNVDHFVEDGKGTVGDGAVVGRNLPDGEHAEEGSGDDADEDVAGNLEDEQHGGDDDADDGKECGAVADGAEVDKGGSVVDDDAAVLESDEGDEEADTGADGMAEVHRDGVDNPLTHLGEGEDDEDDTLKEDGGKGELPGVTHAKADTKNEEGVETHARGKGERFLGIDCHDEGADDGGQCGGGEYCRGGHALVGKGTENAGVHGQDVGHG